MSSRLSFYEAQVKFSLFGEPTAAKRERWERMKALGKKSFVFRVGVLQWGGFMFVVMSLVDLIQKPALPRHFSDYFVDIVVGLIVWPAAGYLFGLCVWNHYENHLSDQNSKDD